MEDKEVRVRLWTVLSKIKELEKEVELLMSDLGGPSAQV